jgi:hypothetical protein
LRTARSTCADLSSADQADPRGWEYPVYPRNPWFFPRSFSKNPRNFKK